MFHEIWIMIFTPTYYANVKWSLQDWLFTLYLIDSSFFNYVYGRVWIYIQCDDIQIGLKVWRRCGQTFMVRWEPSSLSNECRELHHDVESHKVHIYIIHTLTLSVILYLHAVLLTIKPDFCRCDG
jgi:hypothetical protein